MWMNAGELLLMLVVILIAAEVFTNALEHLGERMGISEGVTGSLFAAIATAMPESMVPLLAFTVDNGGGHADVHTDVGVGAILGAPLMLSTLTLCLMALSVVRRRGSGGILQPEKTGLTRDLNFFLGSFSLATLALYTPGWHAVIAVLLLLLYFIYVLLTLRVSAQLVEAGHGTEADRAMFLCRLGLPDHMLIVLVQLGLGLGLLIIGAKGFIQGVEEAATHLEISVLLLSLLIVPVATELPEKVNSILWIRRRKDTLAFGNITGAMVFQGSILPAIGLLMTPWQPRPEMVMGLLITLIAALWLRMLVALTSLRIWHLIVNGALYATYLALMLY
jgi:cation:H+ antiporter